VTYPIGRGRIVLKIGPAWDVQCEPDEVSEDGNEFDFTISSQGPFLYCKPYIISATGTYQACGSGNLVLMTETSRRDIYPHFYTGNCGVISEVLSRASTILGRAHLFRVYLPPGYEENTLKRYPVVYMQDGRNLFFPQESFLGADWHVGQTLDLLDSMSVIDKTIVVGLYAQNREEEYTAPGYRRYGRSIVEEVKPFIDSRYRTLPGPMDTAVMGSSLGGVVSFFMSWEWPEVFGRVACLSSTFAWRDNLMDRVFSERKRDIKIYLDSGWPSDNYEVTLSMAMALMARGYQFGGDLLHFVFPNASHGESAWASRLHLPAQLFSGKLARRAQRLVRPTRRRAA
jgi:predicted alpha/beta superfamily hydrolase